MGGSIVEVPIIRIIIVGDIGVTLARETAWETTGSYHLEQFSVMEGRCCCLLKLPFEASPAFQLISQEGMDAHLVPSDISYMFHSPLLPKNPGI